MSSNLGLFGWIREGVRQSVLLGVSDALESIGSPDSSEKLHPALLAIDANRSSALLESPESSAAGASNSKRGTGGSTATRKRLGRSLKDIEPVSKPATSNP